MRTRTARRILAASIYACGATVQLARASSWTGNGADNNFQTSANWDVAPSAGAVLGFAGINRLNPSNDFAADTAFGGITFLAILIAVEWPFATLLMSPAARHWFLAPNDFPYFAPPTSPTVRHVFVTWETTAFEFWRNIGLAFMFSVLSMRIGITFGNWLSRVKR